MARENKSIDDKLKEHHTKQPNDCWTWDGGKNNVGYGLVRVGDKMRLVHRVAYEEYIGEIPKGLKVYHKCNTYACMNPDHLAVGTQSDSFQYKKHVLGNTYGRGHGYRNRRKVCEHCNRDFGLNQYTRWHGDKCKHKKII